MAFFGKMIKTLADNVKWIALSFGIFLLGAVVYVLFLEGNIEINQVIGEQFEAIEELGREIFEGTWLQGVLLLFLNNLRASLFLMLSGVFAGIPTFLGIFINGALLGFITTMITSEGLSAAPFLILGILPHGIFELPAFFICTAFGFKLGYHLMIPISGLSRMKSLASVLKEFGVVLPLVVALLVIAAFIEILLTPYLLGFLSETYLMEVPDF